MYVDVWRSGRRAEDDMECSHVLSRGRSGVECVVLLLVW
jgi:hypothetical protein